jgi:hypothetical protein
MVFEGEVTEKDIFDNLKQYYLTDNPSTIIYGFHCGEIYSLYNKMEKDCDLELFGILKETLGSKNPELLTINQSDIQEINLFFDYDGHAASAEYTKLELMLEHFNNETENGKLYISYPMVEAIRHLKSSVNFKDTIAKSEKAYKLLTLQNCDDCYKNLSDLSKNDWGKIISEHCRKLGFILYNRFEFPNDAIKQLEIFKKQKENYIDKHNQVAVLSAFPIFLTDYYGYEIFKD